jgi:hypothetical protein
LLSACCCLRSRTRSGFPYCHASKAM